MPVFLAQLLVQLQAPTAIDRITSAAEHNDTATLPTSTAQNATLSTIISYANGDDDDNIWKVILRYTVFIW